MLKIHKNGLNCGTPLGWNQNKPELQTENDSEVTCKKCIRLINDSKKKNFMK